VAARCTGGEVADYRVLGPDAPSWTAWTAAFAERLRQLGWIEGRTIVIEYRWSEGRPERVAEVAGEFVRQKVDVIITYGGAVAAFKQATRDIPIVFAIALDPVGIGLVDSLSRPGGNVTGLSLQLTDLAGKRLELLREALGIRRTEDIAPAFEALKVDALYVVDNALATANRTPIIALAVGVPLPTAFSGREVVEAGGLMSYGPDYRVLFLRAADYVDKILRGTKPDDIPIE
jgi:putative tryptophan/tyrosine transport system substrate-binding protein